MKIGIGAVIEYINKIPDSVVYAIVDDTAKSVYIMHSTKFRTKLGEVADLMAGVQNSTLEYFCISAHPVYKLIMAEQVRLQYINKGYTIQNQTTPFIKFTPGIRIDATGQTVLVYITSSRGLREVVGVFGSMSAAEAFKDEFYGDSWSGVPVYAINKETSRYWRNVVYKRMYGSRAEQSLVEPNEMAQT